MSRRSTPAVLFAVSLFVTGCSSPRGQEMTAAEYTAWEASQRSTELPSRPSDDASRGDELAERAEALADERAQLQFDQRELASDKQQAALRQAVAAAAEQRAASQAQLGLAAARQELEFFLKVGQARALDVLALEQARAEDDLLEAREELAQLELMYGSELGEATAEIVLSRTRRRLARAEERVRLTALQGREVREVELPAQLLALNGEVADGEQALRAAEAQLKLGLLERAAELAGLEHRADQLGRRAASLARRAQRLEEDQRAEERGGSGTSP